MRNKLVKELDVLNKRREVILSELNTLDIKDMSTKYVGKFFKDGYYYYRIKGINEEGDFFVVDRFTAENSNSFTLNDRYFNITDEDTVEITKEEYEVAATKFKKNYEKVKKL